MRSDISILHGICQARENHGYVEELLRIVADGRGKDSGHPVMGLVDVDYHRLDKARGKLGQVSVEEARAVAGLAAAEALAAFKGSFVEVEAAYGRVTGLDRTPAQVEALRDRFVEVAREATGHLMAYWREVGGLEPHTLEQVIAEGRDRDRTRYVPPPRSPAPQVRLPLPGTETAPRARALMGLAFGQLAAAHMIAAGQERNKHTAMIAYSDVTGIATYVGIRAHGLSGRMEAGDHHIGEELVEAIEGIEALRKRFEEPILAKDPEPGALEDFLQAVVERIKDVGNRIRRVERLAALQGYELGEPEAGAAPKP